MEEDKEVRRRTTRTARVSGKRIGATGRGKRGQPGIQGSGQDHLEEDKEYNHGLREEDKEALRRTARVPGKRTRIPGEGQTGSRQEKD